MLDRTIGPRHACAEEIWLDPNESCLAQRFRNALYVNVGPAMIGTMVVADRIFNFARVMKTDLLKNLSKRRDIIAERILKSTPTSVLAGVV